MLQMTKWRHSRKQLSKRKKQSCVTAQTFMGHFLLLTRLWDRSDDPDVSAHFILTLVQTISSYITSGISVFLLFIVSVGHNSQCINKLKWIWHSPDSLASFINTLMKHTVHPGLLGSLFLMMLNHLYTDIFSSHIWHLSESVSAVY